MSPHCDLELEDSNFFNFFFCMTLGFMMVYRYTKFGYKRFNGWGDIIEMNIYWNS